MKETLFVDIPFSNGDIIHREIILKNNGCLLSLDDKQGDQVNITIEKSIVDAVAKEQLRRAYYLNAFKFTLAMNPFNRVYNNVTYLKSRNIIPIETTIKDYLGMIQSGEMELPSQKSFIYNKKNLNFVDFVCRDESISSDIRYVLDIVKPDIKPDIEQIIHNIQPKYDATFTDEEVKLIYNYFVDDFEYFGYHKLPFKQRQSGGE